MAAPQSRRYITAMIAKPHDPLTAKRRRFRPIPVRMLVPNLITLLALCAGLTAIRLAFEQKLEWAVAAIVFAALLDGIDGRVARMLKGTSRFGAELDSLADFVNFGVAPALILYFWGLHELGHAGWIAAMVFAICTGLRLARFNVMIDDPNRPVWAGNFFVGMPAPAGAITVLLPLYLYFLGALGILRLGVVAPMTFVYTLGIAFLMVSRLPVFSGKRVGKRVSPDMVVPVFVVVSYRNHERKSAAGVHATQPGVAAALEGDSPSLSPAHPSSEQSQNPEHPERPSRLN
jgi:CDP-diacylglycerol--serine O-phosphatidyltransferase